MNDIKRVLTIAEDDERAVGCEIVEVERNYKGKVVVAVETSPRS